VPGSALSEVEKIAGDTDDIIKITVGAKHVIFTIGSTTLVSRRLEGEFLNYRQAIPQNNKYSIEVDKRAVISCVERVSIIINEKLKSPVRCTFEDNMFKILTTTSLGKAYDECEVKGDGEGLEIGFNNKYLLDALKAAPADKIVIKLSSGVSPCIIIPADNSTNFLYMILPVRLKSNEG
jgi:DNA polymerase-3 subunit beta